MRSGVVWIAFGMVLLVFVFVMNENDRRLLDDDRRDVAGLTAQLDSVRSTLALATSAADSGSITSEVQMREARLARRAFHIPMRAERVEQWWSLTGGGSIGLFFALLLLGLGVWSLRGRVT